MGESLEPNHTYPDEPALDSGPSGGQAREEHGSGSGLARKDPPTGPGDRTRRIITAFSKAISITFNPLVVPLLGVILLLFGDTALRFLPMALKWYYVALGALATVVIPSLSILLMKNLGMVSGISLSVRRERFLPLSVVLTGYVVFLCMIRGTAAAFLIERYVLAAVGCTVMAIGVTAFWKISAHMIAVGGLSAMLVLMTVTGLGNMVVPLIVLVLLSGLIGSARLWLGRHTLAQVTAGYFGGFAVAWLILWFL